MTFEVLFPPEFVATLLGLLLGILLDLGFGIMVAIKYHRFEWKKIADFYGTSVLPVAGGWAIASTIMRLVPVLGVPWLSDAATTAITGLSGLAATALTASILVKVAELKAPVPAPAETVTMTVTLPTPQAPAPTVTASDEQGRDIPVTPQDGSTGP